MKGYQFNSFPTFHVIKFMYDVDMTLNYYEKVNFLYTSVVILARFVF